MFLNSHVTKFLTNDIPECKEYSKIGIKRTQFSSLSLSSKPQEGSSKSCDAMTGLVVGGKNAGINEFPHQAAIGYEESNGIIGFYCGGSLISELFVLTAAHCKRYDNSSPKFVRLGDLNLKVIEPGLPEVNIPIDQFIRHEDFRQSSREHDIAVVKMSYPVTLSLSIRPACLQQTTFLESPKAIATGWGKVFILPIGIYLIVFLQGQTGTNKATSDILQKVQLDIISNQQCANVYDEVFETQLCAGDLEGGGKDTCNGGLHAFNTADKHS